MKDANLLYSALKEIQEHNEEGEIPSLFVRLVCYEAMTNCESIQDKKYSDSKMLSECERQRIEAMAPYCPAWDQHGHDCGCGEFEDGFARGFKYGSESSQNA